MKQSSSIERWFSHFILHRIIWRTHSNKDSQASTPEFLVQWVGPKNLVPSSSQVPGTTLWEPLIYKAITCPYVDWKYLVKDKIWTLELLLLHEGLCTNTIGITRKFVRNAESQVPCQTCWIRICVLTGSLHDSFALESLRNTPIGESDG